MLGLLKASPQRYDFTIPPLTPFHCVSNVFLNVRQCSVRRGHAATVVLAFFNHHVARLAQCAVQRLPRNRGNERLQQPSQACGYIARE